MTLNWPDRMNTLGGTMKPDLAHRLQTKVLAEQVQKLMVRFQVDAVLSNEGMLKPAGAQPPGRD